MHHVLPYELTSNILQLAGPSISARVCTAWRDLIPEKQRPLTPRDIITPSLVQYTEELGLPLLPVLKISLETGNADVYQHLLMVKLYPEVETLLSKCNLHLSDSVDTLQWVMATCPRWKKRSTFLLSSAAGSGNLQVLKYLWEVEKVEAHYREGILHPLRNALHYGHLECVKYLVPRYPDVSDLEEDCTAASIPCLEWLMTKDFQLDTNFLKFAVHNSDIQLCSWLLDHGVSCDLDEPGIQEGPNTIQILELLFSRGYHWNIDSDVESVTMYLSLNTLKWLNNRPEVTWNSRVYYGAIWNNVNKRGIISYFLQLGIPFDPEIYSDVVGRKKLGLIRFLRSKGLPWNEDEMIEEAMRVNSLKVVKYLLQEGCRLSPYLHSVVSMSPHWRDKDYAHAWLREHGCPE